MCVFYQCNVKKTNILKMSLALFAVCKGAWWVWWTHGEIPYHWWHWFADDDWWWWSLRSRWMLTTFFFHRKTASWPPSPGGFWPTMFFSLVIFGQRSFFVSIFPIDVNSKQLTVNFEFCLKIFFPHCLKNDIFTVYDLSTIFGLGLRVSKSPESPGLQVTTVDPETQRPRNIQKTSKNYIQP